MFGFQKFKTMQSFGKHVLNGTLTLDNAIDDSINLEKNWSIISKNLQNQEFMKKKKKKKKRMKKNYSSGVRIVPQGKTMNY